MHAVRQDVLPVDLVARAADARALQLRRKRVGVGGDVAQLLLDVVDEEVLVHHVPLAVRDELLEVIGQSLAPEIDAPHSRADHAPVEHGRDVREGEAHVHHHAAPSVDGKLFHFFIFVVARGRVSRPSERLRHDQACGSASHARLEPEVLEHRLVLRGGQRGQVERRLRQHQVALPRIHLEQLGKHVVPDVLLQVPVHDVPAVDRAPQVQRRHVLDAVNLVADVRALFALGLGDAVRHDAAAAGRASGIAVSASRESAPRFVRSRGGGATYNAGVSSPAKPTLMVEPPLSSTMMSFRVGIAGTTRPRAKWPVTADVDANVAKKFAENRLRPQSCHSRSAFDFLAIWTTAPRKQA